MRASTSLVCVSTALLLLAGASCARATVITWYFEGNASGEGLPGGYCEPLGCQDILYAPFTGHVTLDSDAIDLAADPYRGYYVYSGGPYGLTLEIGGYTYETAVLEITVASDPLPLPEYSFGARDPGEWFQWIELFQCYPSGVITSDAQGVTPPPVAGGSGGCPDPSFIRTNTNFDIELAITRYYALVPLPASATLLAFALAGTMLFGLASRTRPA